MDRDKIQEEALNEVLKYDRCGVGISMGVGKTLLALKHADYHYKSDKRYLVVAPKKAIMKSWKSDAEEFGFHHILDKITFTTYLSLPKQDLNYDIVYLDECHSLLNSHNRWLSSYKGKILGLTGTPPIRVGTEKYEMVSKYCPIKYKYVTDEAVTDNILNNYKIYVHLLQVDKVDTYYVGGKGKSFPTTEFKSYNYWSQRVHDADTPKARQIAGVMRMKAMQEFPSKEKYAAKLFNSINDKCILFCNTQDQADKLCDYSYHSKNADSEANLDMFKSGKIDKLSCVLQLNEGVNIPNLKHGIVMHAYGNERKFAQRLGRMLRLNPKDVAHIHVLCYENTVDEKWVLNALESFDDSKIEYFKLSTF